jgi:uncharacterized protein YqeY
MTLREQLQQDLHQAMRDRDVERKSAIRLVRAAIVNEEISRQRELDDDEVLAILRREVRQYQESLAAFEAAGRGDLVSSQKARLETLYAYLPPQLSREEIELAVQEAIAETDAKTLRELGPVMRLVMPRLNGRADGGVVNQIARELLSSGKLGDA